MTAIGEWLIVQAPQNVVATIQGKPVGIILKKTE